MVTGRYVSSKIPLAVAILLLFIIFYSLPLPIFEHISSFRTGGATWTDRLGRSKDSSPYAGSPFDGHSRLSMYKKPNQKIVGFILAGRREYVEVMDCYLQRNLERNGGWLSQVVWIVRTNVQSDLDYLNELVDSVPEYSGHPWSIIHSKYDYYSEMYKLCGSENICIKIDDDVVFWEDHTIPAIVTRLVDNPQYSLVSANVMNQPALSWVHYHLNTAKPYLPEITMPDGFEEDESLREANLDWRPSTMPTWDGPAQFKFDEFDPAPFKGHRWLRVPDTSDTRNTPLGILEHYSFLENLENNELWRYKFDVWHYHYERLSINFIAFWGIDVQQNPIEGSDESYLTMTLPKKLNRPAVLDGTAMAVHFGFHRQVYGHGGIKGSALNHTDLLGRYRSFAKEYICGLPIGSPRP